MFSIIWQIKLPIYIANNKSDEDDFIPMITIAITYWILWIISVVSIALSFKNNSSVALKISVFFTFVRCLISIFDIEKSRKYVY